MEPPAHCPNCFNQALKIARCLLYPGQWVMICPECYHAMTCGADARRMFEARLGRVAVFTPAVPMKDRVWN